MKIRFEREYRQAPIVVWQALTDARAIRQWWVDTDFAPEIGRQFFFKDEPQGSWDGVVRGTVLEVRSPVYVKFTWAGGGHDTIVTYELEPLQNGGTKLTLVHDGFRGLSGLFLSSMLRFGWGGLVKKLVPQMAAHIAQHGFEQAFASPDKAARLGAARMEHHG